MYSFNFIQDSSSELEIVEVFTSRPENQLSLSFSELREAKKFIDAKSDESEKTREKINELRKKIAEANDLGWTQVVTNLQREIIKLLPSAS